MSDYIVLTLKNTYILLLYRNNNGQVSNVLAASCPQRQFIDGKLMALAQYIILK